MSQPVQHVAAANLAALGLPKLNEYRQGGSGKKKSFGHGGGGHQRGSYGHQQSGSHKPVRARTLERKLKRAKGTNRQMDRESGVAIAKVAQLQKQKARLQAKIDALSGPQASSVTEGDDEPKPEPKKSKTKPVQPPVKKARLLPSTDGSQAAPSIEEFMRQQSGRVDENGERPWDVDEELRFYEQALGVRKLKKKKKTPNPEADDDSDDAVVDEAALRRLKKELAEDGLDDLWDFCEKLESTVGETEEDENASSYPAEKARAILAKEAEMDRKQQEIEDAFKASMKDAAQDKKKGKKRKAEEEEEEVEEPEEDEQDEDEEEVEDDDDADELMMADDESNEGDQDEDDEDMENEDDEDGADEDADMNEPNEEDEEDESKSNSEPADSDEKEPEIEEEPKKQDLYGFSAPLPESLLAFRRGEKNLLGAASGSSTSTGAAATAGSSASLSAPTKYIPPHLRAQMAAAAAAANPSADPSSAENATRLAALRRQLKGLLNRLTTANLENIAKQIQETLYKQHSKREVTDILCEEMLSLCTSEADSAAGGYVVGSNSNTLLASSALVVFLHATIGQDIGAHFLEKFVLAFNELSSKSTDGLTLLQQSNNLKSCSTLITFLTYLYNFDLISSQMIYEFVRKFVNEFKAESVELLLIILQNCGYQLRKADPTALKEIILLVQAKAKQATAAATSATSPSALVIPEGRVSFMLEMIYDLKNNKKRHSGIYESIQPLQNWLQGKLKRKKTAEGGELQLRFGLEDILNIPQKGRWWLVGSAWKGKRLGEEEKENKTSTGSKDKSSTSTKVTLPVEESTDEVDLLSLARSQNMNTDLRKSLFLIIMSACDYMDSYEKLCKLNLPPAQFRQVIKVLIDCSQNEQKYNPYYSYLTLQLCRMDGGKEFKFTLQLTLWDLIKEWTEDAIQVTIKQQRLKTVQAKEAFVANKNRQALNLSKMLALLLRETSGVGLNLNWFKCINFHDISSIQLLFLTSCFKDLLTQAEVPALNQMFLRLHTQIYDKKKPGAIDKSDEFLVLRDGLDFFFQHHLLPTATSMIKSTNPKTKEQGTLLKQRIQTSRQAMQGQVSDDWMFKK